VETFREESKQRLTKLDEKIGRKRLLQAQPYYDAVRDGNNAKSLLETHQRNLAHILDELEAAREMLSRTEQELVAEGINDELREMHQQSARKLETVGVNVFAMFRL
jgi:protein subunit release factor A